MREGFGAFIGEAVLVAWGTVLLSMDASAAVSWKPVSKEELALRGPVVEAGADAEALFWDVRMSDDVSSMGNTYLDITNHVRIKVFTEKGRAERTLVELPYREPGDIRDIAARTVRPDGTALELDRGTIREKTVLKAGGIRWKVKSFTLPSVEVGSVVEYRWTEEIRNQLLHYQRLDIQRDLPIQVASYFFKPLSIPGYRFRAWASGMKFPGFTETKDGFRTSSVKDIPTFREEPQMVPPDMVKRWLLLYYTQSEAETPDAFWKEVGTSTFREWKSLLKARNGLKKFAAAVTANDANPESQLRKLFDQTRSKVRNVSRESSGVTREERARLARTDDPEDVLSRGSGTATQINQLFGALAASAGFEVRVVLTGDRSRWLFTPKYSNRYFLNNPVIGVKVSERWRLFDPGSFHVPFGMLRWQQEGQEALVCDATEPFFVEVPATGPELSRDLRKGVMRLGRDGGLEGDVRVEYTGHRAAEKRLEIDGWKADEREKLLRESEAGRIEGAEVTGFEVAGLEDVEAPLVLRYHLAAPLYATRSASRVVLAPALFQRGQPAKFASSQRLYPIFFPFGWTEEDEVRIELPAGGRIDDLSWARPLEIGSFGMYGSGIAVDSGVLTYRRFWRLTGGLFPVSDYPALKKGFEILHAGDGRELAVVVSPQGQP